MYGTKDLQQPIVQMQSWNLGQFLKNYPGVKKAPDPGSATLHLHKSSGQDADPHWFVSLDPDPHLGKMLNLDPH
jgi:hypothetical protein